MPQKGPVLTPQEWIPGNPPSSEGGEGVKNGEPGYPGRTMGPNSIAEVTLDECGEFKNAEKAEG
jgi:hypothetical protein